MSLGRLHYVLAPNMLDVTLVILPPRALCILEWIEAPRIVTTPLYVVALRPPLDLCLLGHLIEVGDVRIDTRVIFLTQQPLNVIAVLEAVLGFLMQFGVLGAHA